MISLSHVNMLLIVSFHRSAIMRCMICWLAWVAQHSSSPRLASGAARSAIFSQVSVTSHWSSGARSAAHPLDWPTGWIMAERLNEEGKMPAARIVTAPSRD